MMVQIEQKRMREKQVVTKMIAIYCHGQHKTKKGLCADCQALTDYAMLRSDKCPFMETKTFCSNCTVSCYKTDMRDKIRKVMRYAGPRMILHHPLMAVRHLVESKREKKRLASNRS